MDILLDTNILLIYGRGNEVADHIENQYRLFSKENRIVISVVTLGEINSLIKNLDIGKVRTERMQTIVDKATIVDIHYQEVIDAYGDIDKFSAGKVRNQVTKNRFSSRNMGKNDLWIAATAKVFGLILVTTDKDFNHLNGEMVNVLYVDMDRVKSEINNDIT